MNFFTIMLIEIKNSKNINGSLRCSNTLMDNHWSWNLIAKKKKKGQEDKITPYFVSPFSGRNLSCMFKKSMDSMPYKIKLLHEVRPLENYFVGHDDCQKIISGFIVPPILPLWWERLNVGGMEWNEKCNRKKKKKKTKKLLKILSQECKKLFWIKISHVKSSQVHSTSVWSHHHISPVSKTL